MQNRLRRRARLILAAAVITLVASPLQAQGVATGVDPIALQTEITANPDFDIASLWRRLKIPADLDTVYAKVGTTPPAPAAPFDSCSSSCRAELTRADVDGDGSNEAILVIYQASRSCRFLLFKGNPTSSGATEWRFLGQADHDALGQYEPEYRVSFLGGRHYFVVLTPGVHGTGMWLRYERWYEVGTSGMREVLSLPTDGFECRDRRSLCRAFGSTVVASRNGTRGEELTASFTVRYWGDEFLLDESRSDQIPLFGRTQRAVYVRPLKSSERYEHAPLDSDIASWEVDTVFRLEALTCQDFLVSNTDTLLQIASGSASAARQWLSRYIDGCSPSKQRTDLLGLLAK